MPRFDLDWEGLSKGPIATDYTWKDAALYALAVGAEADELPLIYERHPGGMKVLPGFAVVPALAAWPDMEGIEWPLVIHGEMIIRMRQPLPPSGRLLQTGRVQHIYDKGKGALLEVSVTAELADRGPVFDAQWNIFYLGAGGFGGERGPSSPVVAPPAGQAADLSVTYQVPGNQAALYRLLGDLNPLHIDPAAAALGGFPRPILHGLCTYGYMSRAIVNGLLGGDPDGIKELSTRFAAPVFPGDELTVHLWKDGNRCLVEAETANGKVLKNGLAILA